jgi:hypothetical protein
MRDLFGSLLPITMFIGTINNVLLRSLKKEFDFLFRVDGVNSKIYRSYVRERENDDPSWNSNHRLSAIRADVISQLD